MSTLRAKENGSEQKLWIFGDSFTGQYFLENSWQWILYQKFVGKKIYISSRGSRDTQTIIDIFLRNLHKIKPTDLVILFLPTMCRWRLPLKNPAWDVEWSSDLLKNEDYEKQSLLDYFIGSLGYAAAPTQSERELEEPLSLLPYTIFEPTKNYADLLDNLDASEFDKIKKNISNLSIGDVNSMISASNANLKNMNEILNSFKKYFPFELYIISWTNEYDENIVEGRKHLENSLKEWHTQHMDYIETNGESGSIHDFHWSKKMNKLFADYVIVKFPQFFNL